MSIERNVDGLADHWINMMEAIDMSEDMDVEKKIKLSKSCSQEVREMAKLNLAYKAMMQKSPEIAKNTGIVLPVGTPQLEAAKKAG